MDNKLPQASSFSRKIILVLSLLLCNLFIQAQCPCSCGTCTWTVSTTVATNYTVNAGQTLCILAGGNVTGSITLNGGTVCNSGNITPTAINYTFYGTFNNCGTITGSFSIYMDGATDFLYNCSGGTLHLTSGGITLNGGGYFKNDGLITLDNGDILDQGGDMFINNGTITINNGHDFTQNGSNGGFCNNGTINMTSVGSHFLGNGDGSSNHGTINAYDFDINGNNFYNACTINVLHDFYANGGSMTGPTAAGQYGKYNITGSSGYNGCDIGLGGSHLDICDAGNPVGNWDSKNGGSIGTGVTYCVNAASCIGTGACTIPCTLPVPSVAGTSTICNGDNTTLTAGGTGTYSWNTGATTSTISVSPISTTTYTLTVTNSCGSVTKSQAVTVNSVNPGITGTSSICNGKSTTLTGTGGGTYSWNTGATTTAITVSPTSSTTYTVTVTNSGCTTATVKVVTVNSLPTPGITGTTTICSGFGTTLTGTGGGTYSWNTGPTSTSITVSPGATTTYTVTVTNASGCTAKTSEVVTVNTTPTPGITGTITICSGKTTTLTGTGGGTYNWNTGATSTAITVSPGTNTTYTVTVTSGSGCTATIAQAVTVNTTPTPGITGTTTICNGLGTTLTGTGGGTYSWNTGPATTAITVSPSANTTYTVTVSSGAGCTAIATKAVVVNALPTATMGSTNTACGGSVGTATVTATGTATLTYLWSPGGQTTAGITGLSSGSYNVTVTDGNGCTKNAAVSVNNATGPTASISSQFNVLCTGSATGTATVTGTGGTGTLTYLWSPGGQTTTTVTGLSAGTYICTVTDANGCAQGQSVTITQPAAPISANISSQNNVGCTGSATGSATVTVTGGTGGYTYSWSPGGQTTPSISGLTTGAYVVTITDGNGCTVQQTAAITQPASAVGSTVTSQSNVGCTGSATGSASVTGTGGTPTYTYSWSPGGQTTSAVTGLTTGSYNVTITDANGCTKVQTVAITQPASALGSTITSQNNVGCTGSATGSAAVTGTGGTPTYTYIWSPGGQTTSAVTGLTTGSYNVIITDNNGCTKVQTVAITQPASAIGSIISSQNNVGCTGSATGSATVTGTGGTPTYTYSWSPGGQTTPAVTGLTTGSYNVTVTDNNGCTTIQTVAITQPASALYSGISTQGNVDCFGGVTGDATVTAGGGTPIYTYSWSPGGQTSSMVSGLSSGTYNVTITDANGCTKVQSIAITQPASPLSATVSSQSNVGCTGSATGTATVTGSGGTPNYSYDWLPTGSTGPNAGGLTAGTYTVTITDIKGCTKQQTVTITQPASVIGTAVSSVDATCGNSNGTATVTATGGTPGPGYTYSWSPSGGTNATATGLGAGGYVVLVTDANGCTNTTNVSVNNAGSPTVTIDSKSDVNCTGSATGSATVTVTGGTPNYTYNWTPSGGTGSSATGLTSGSYNCTVTDFNGCIQVQNVVITQPASGLGSTISSQDNVGCTGSATGSATVTGTGGTPIYNYSWSPGGQTTPAVSGLTSGSYVVTITDSKGCSKTQSVAITQPASGLGSTINSQTNVGCTGSATGSATVIGTGGTPTYTYSWSPGGNTTAVVSGLTAGTYSVTISDFNGCVTIQTVAITQPASALGSNTSAITATCGNSNGSATVTATGGTPIYKYLWSPIGGTNANATGLSAGSYNVIVTDANGCTSTSVVAVNNAGGPTVTISSQSDAKCNGSATGTATVSVSGGTPGYTYNWSPSGGTAATAVGLTAGTYNCTVADTNGCIQVQTITINQPTVLNTSISSQNDVGCTGSSTGSATVTGSGGTPTYTYSWNPGGQTTPDVTGLTAGTYSVTVTDLKGCSKEQTVIITQPLSSIGSTITSQNNVGCTGSSTGSATVTGTGGTPNYNYSWSPGGQTTPNVTGLTAGTYTVLVSDNKGCSTTQTVAITQPLSVIIPNPSSTNAACGSSNGTITVSPTGGTAPFTYSWTTPNNDITPTVIGLVKGNYTVTVTDKNGCTQTANVLVNGSPGPSLGLTSTDITCNGKNDGTATSSVTSGTAPYIYTWNPSAGNTPSVSGLSANTYTLVVTDSAGCADTATVKITNPLPITFTLTASSNTICAGESLTLMTSNLTGGTPPFTYTWLPAGPNVNPLIPTTYSLTVTDGSGCISLADTILITPLPTPTAGFDTLSSGIFGQKYTFNDLSTGGNSWYWNFGDGVTSNLQNPYHTFPGAGTYTVTQIVTSSSGCSDTISKVIVILPNILIPNVFTPNHDGVNDEFFIPNTGFESFDLVIYDRWGLKLFETDQGEIRWDGRTAAGDEATDGTYFFLLKGVLKTGMPVGKDYAVKGFIDLHRSGAARNK